MKAAYPTRIKSRTTLAGDRVGSALDTSRTIAHTSVVGDSFTTYGFLEAIVFLGTLAISNKAVYFFSVTGPLFLKISFDI